MFWCTGYFRIETGHNSLGIEAFVVWATPGSWTVKNKACYESGSNCGVHSEYFKDPSANPDLYERRIREDKSI